MYGIKKVQVKYKYIQVKWTMMGMNVADITLVHVIFSWPEFDLLHCKQNPFPMYM